MIGRRVCILGVGLLGGSVGLRLIRDGLAEEVVGWGRSQDRLDSAVRLGAIHRGATEISEAAQDADLVLACTPVREIPAALLQASRFASPNVVLTDVGSTKSTIVEALRRTSAGTLFLGSHPLAGSHRSGVENASADLFDHRLVVLTPTSETSQELIDTLEHFWSALGASTELISPEEHDEAMSVTSHLPHVVAAILASVTPVQMLSMTGTGWSDTTRIAGGDPQLWRQILQENRGHVLHALKNFATISEAWIEALEGRDFDRVEQLLKAGKQIRDIVGSRHTSS